MTVVILRNQTLPVLLVDNFIFTNSIRQVLHKNIILTNMGEGVYCTDLQEHHDNPEVAYNWGTYTRTDSWNVYKFSVEYTTSA